MDLTPRELQEHIVALQQELENREKDDPLKIFAPQSKQKPFIDAVLDGKTRCAAFFGANRSGKTAIGAYVGATLARFGPKNPRSLPHDGATIQVRDRATSGWVYSLDTNVSRDVVEPKYFDNGFVSPGAPPPFIPKREIIEWRMEDKILKLKNGSLVGFKSAEAGPQKAQGAGKDWVHIDEELPKPIYEEVVIRVEGGRPLVIFITCTLLPPIGQVGGVSWMYNDIIKAVQDGKRKDIMLFGASIYDNKFIGKEEIAALEALYPIGSAARRIRLDGEWIPGIGGARAYPGFQRQIHVRPQPPPKERRPLCFLWDFNVEPLITLVGQRDMDLFRVYGELVMDEGNIPEMCQMFYDRFGGHRGEIHIYGDSTGQGRRPQYSQSDYAVILNELRRFQLSVRLKIPAHNPPVPERLNAMNRALKNEEGLSLIEIDPSCTELTDDLEQVLLDPRGGIKKSHNKKETYYRRTHSSDSLGYWIAYEAPVRIASQKGGNVISFVKDVSYAFR